MFAVQIRVDERNEQALTNGMTAMREWLDHRRFEPAVFRYTFLNPGVLFRLEFEIEAEAAKFAAQFGGRLIPAAGDTAG